MWETSIAVRWKNCWARFYVERAVNSAVSFVINFYKPILAGEMNMDNKVNAANKVNMAIDPVCGMEVEPAQAAGQSEYKGQTYYFCAPGCKRQFDKDPERYVSQAINHDNKSNG